MGRLLVWEAVALGFLSKKRLIRWALVFHGPEVVTSV
jgi:hypothetical protein